MKKISEFFKNLGEKISDFFKDKDFKEIIKDKRVLIGIGVVLVLIIALIVGTKLKKEKDLIDMGGLMDEQASEKSEEQLQYHYMITRNTQWGDDYSDILVNEEGNVLDYDKNTYITVDYETLFDLKFLPTYLFEKGKLVAILYEADLTAEDVDTVSLTHSGFAASISYVYENLYRENNKWSSGQDRKYDTNLWSKAVLDGKLTEQSIWNSNSEKVFLITGQKSYFKFIEKNKERDLTPSMSFIVIADDYIENHTFNDIVKITPKGN